MSQALYRESTNTSSFILKAELVLGRIVAPAKLWPISKLGLYEYDSAWKRVLKSIAKFRVSKYNPFVLFR